METDCPIPNLSEDQRDSLKSPCRGKASTFLVPSLVHFIFFGDSTPFRFLHYLAIVSARHRLNPDEIIVHGRREPVESQWWEKITPLVTFEKVEPVREFRGKRLYAYQHQADVMRLEILIERGGIYLDIDVLTLRSLDALRGHSCVIGGERYLDDRETSFSNDPRDFASVTNAVLMAAPESPFLQEWYERLEIGDDWAHHAVVTPHELILERPELAHVEPVESFMPFNFREEFVFAELPSKERDLLLEKRFAASYTAHFWETVWGHRHLYAIDPASLATQQNLFADLVGGLPI